MNLTSNVLGCNEKLWLPRLTRAAKNTSSFGKGRGVSDVFALCKDVRWLHLLSVKTIMAFSKGMSHTHVLQITLVGLNHLKRTIRSEQLAKLVS